MMHTFNAEEEIPPPPQVPAPPVPNQKNPDFGDGSPLGN